ncbi:hypothetical protein NP493_728g00016 [Ridgeia piscesae]|uniref:HAT C-terminal dimerisation domain-containing protein n=1 Tax=Ridgeia piscesae TaxID=27915 RepID=A0AAD9KPW6_RIDPI|nr:hypothetical protein NP493_728g00016 [Ridgeia piscesae]
MADIMLLVRLVFTTSPSTAACERGFSAMNAIKNIRRKRISGETLSTLMRVNVMPQTLKEFDTQPLPSRSDSTAQRTRDWWLGSNLDMFL